MSTAVPGGHLTIRRARQLETVHRAVMIGLHQAAEHLSVFLGVAIEIESPRLGICRIDELVACTLGDAFDLVAAIEAEQVRTGIYLGIEGMFDGHFIMLLQPAQARALVEPLVAELEMAPDRREEMILSAIGEVGNITASGVLNSLADMTHQRIAPSCPAVVTDMAGAILELPMLDIAQVADDVLYIETRILVRDSVHEGALAIIPRPQGLEMLIDTLGATKGRRK